MKFIFFFNDSKAPKVPGFQEHDESTIEKVISNEKITIVLILVCVKAESALYREKKVFWCTDIYTFLILWKAAFFSYTNWRSWKKDGHQGSLLSQELCYCASAIVSVERVFKSYKTTHCKIFSATIRMI